MTFKRILLTAICACVFCSALSINDANAQKKAKGKAVEPAPAAVEFQLPSLETDAEKAERMKWFTDARFGMFIHWGLYALPARHEWVKNSEYITDADYQKYFDHFNPDLFNPKEWARQAKEAGMKYVVITTKHHEGFCLFDSKYTDYKAPNTPAGRDLLREFVDAFRAEGIHIGFYYSLLDWHHPDYTLDTCHPLRPKPDVAPERAKAIIDSLNQGRNMDVYRQYMKDQVTELLTNYGKIDIIWFDFTLTGQKEAPDWDSEGLLKLARTLQPGIIVDDRLGLRDTWGGWDIITPEQRKLESCATWHGKKVHWETCQTFSGSWGYYRDETSWKSSAMLIELLIETVSKAGNLILNVGPTARGEFDYRAQDRLKAIGEWMHFNSKAIYGCTEAPEEFKKPDNSLLTYNPETNTLYISLLTYPMKRIDAKFMDKVEYAQFLHDGSEISFDEDGFLLPILKPNTEIPVIEVFLKK